MDQIKWTKMDKIGSSVVVCCSSSNETLAYSSSCRKGFDRPNEFKSVQIISNWIKMDLIGSD